MEQHYVTIEEVAKYFTVSVSTVRGWIRKNMVPPSSYLKIGGVYRFRLAEVEAALRGNPIEQTAPEVAVPAAHDSKQLELDFNPDEDI